MARPTTRVTRKTGHPSTRLNYTARETLLNQGETLRRLSCRYHKAVSLVLLAPGEGRSLHGHARGDEGLGLLQQHGANVAAGGCAAHMGLPCPGLHQQRF